MTNTRMTDPEVLEKRFPVRVRSFPSAAVPVAAAGHAGGDGIVRQLRFLDAMTVTTLTSHRVTRPFGKKGGADGASGENSVLRRDGTVEQLRGNDHTDVEPGDVFCMKTPGGGGWSAKNGD